jgi:hypothetical protein
LAFSNKKEVARAAMSLPALFLWPMMNLPISSFLIFFFEGAENFYWDLVNGVGCLPAFLNFLSLTSFTLFGATFPFLIFLFCIFRFSIKIEKKL